MSLPLMLKYYTKRLQSRERLGAPSAADFTGDLRGVLEGMRC